MGRIAELENFVAVARAGSISRAASQMRAAKSAVSRRLSDLETRLGVQLINRTTRQMNLTDAGAAFLIRAESILDELNEAEASLRDGHHGLSGKLRIAAPLSFGLSHLQPPLSQFIKAHPNLSIDVDFSDRRVNLIEEGFDVALRIGVLTDSSLIARKIAPIHHTVAAAPSFWERHGRPKEPEDLETLKCLRYSNQTRPETIRYWAPHGKSGSIAPPIKMLASNGDFVASMALDGYGFIVEPKFIIAPYLRVGKLEAVLEEYEWSEMNLYLVYPPTRRISSRAQAFSDAIVAYFKGDAKKDL
jgi:DNA-binding transcriptional LysR family regulator